MNRLKLLDHRVFRAEQQGDEAIIVQRSDLKVLINVAYLTQSAYDEMIRMNAQRSDMSDEVQAAADALKPLLKEA